MLIIFIIQDKLLLIFLLNIMKEFQKPTFDQKTLTPNQMLKRLPIALAQVKAGNNSESLLNEIRQIVYFLYRSKKITKKV